MTRQDADDVADTLPGFEPASHADDPASQATVTRIVRVARAQVQGSAMDWLFAARRRVLGDRRVPGLSGAVLHVGGWFVLWQEGPPEAVQAALEPLPRRRRYGTARLIHRSVGARTLHEPLALSITQWPESPERFALRLDAVAAEARRLSPDEVWRALSEPSLLAEASDAGVPRRMVLLASDGQRSVEMARRLAEPFGCPLVYRRFASAEPGSIDVGAAYVDLPLPQGALRLHVVSRRAFGHALVQQSLRHASRIVLVAGDQHARARELAGEVAAFAGRAGLQPVIELIADAPEIGADLAAFLGEHARATVAQHARPRADAQFLALLLGASPA